MNREPTASVEALTAGLKALGDELVRVDREIAGTEAALLKAGCRVPAWIAFASDEEVQAAWGDRRRRILRRELGWARVGEAEEARWAICVRESTLEPWGEVEEIVEEGRPEFLRGASVPERVLGAARLPELLGALEAEIKTLLRVAQEVKP
jgi:hypothetical protein